MSITDDTRTEQNDTRLHPVIIGAGVLAVVGVIGAMVLRLLHLI